jgi:flagella basal body P-ring formation protein FlgA
MNRPSIMTFYIKALPVLFALSLAHGAIAQQANTRQNHELLRQTAEQFLHTEAAGLPGGATISVGPIDARLNLPSCPAPEGFLPAGSRAWGKTTVGVRCTVPSPWTVYVSATVRVRGDYIVAAAPLAQGQSIGPNDVAKVKGDLTTLPAGIITDPSQAIGRTLSIALPAGAPLRQDSLRNQQAIRQGQSVRLVSTGPGFQVSGEARALTNANEGQVTQARTSSGQLVSGVARMGGVVEVAF